MSKQDDARRKKMRRLLSAGDGVLQVAADDLRWLLDEAARLQQGNDRLRRQNRRLRLRAGGSPASGDATGDDLTGDDAAGGGGPTP